MEIDCAAAAAVQESAAEYLRICRGNNKIVSGKQRNVFSAVCVIHMQYLNAGVKVFNFLARAPCSDPVSETVHESSIRVVTGKMPLESAVS